VRSAPVLLLVLVIAGCGGHEAGKPPGPPPPTLTSVCGGVPAGLHPQVSWLETSDGVRLYSASAGSGDRAVVLAPESGGAGVCGWLPTMRFLASHGFRSVAFDFRGIYPSKIPPAQKSLDWSNDLQAAVDAADGKHTALVGASFGGAAAVAYAPDLKGVGAVVSVSGELQLPNPHIDAIGNAARLRAPLLVIASRLDGYLDTAEARQLVRRAGSKDKTVVLYPGRLHGWDILDYRPEARQLLARWLTQRLR
jgi:alpha-beta hydrolase superfamily lysophospholipase